MKTPINKQNSSKSIMDANQKVMYKKLPHVLCPLTVLLTHKLSASDKELLIINPCNNLSNRTI